MLGTNIKLYSLAFHGLSSSKAKQGGGGLQSEIHVDINVIWECVQSSNVFSDNLSLQTFPLLPVTHQVKTVLAVLTLEVTVCPQCQVCF